MDKAVVLILLVASVGCIEIGIEETATPEDVLINFLNCTVPKILEVQLNFASILSLAVLPCLYMLHWGI